MRNSFSMHHYSQGCLGYGYPYGDIHMEISIWRYPYGDPHVDLHGDSHRNPVGMGMEIPFPTLSL